MGNYSREDTIRVNTVGSRSKTGAFKKIVVQNVFASILIIQVKHYQVTLHGNAGICFKFAKISSIESN